MSPTNPNRSLLLIGTYTRGGSEGIYAAWFDRTGGALTLAGCVAKTANPSFLALHPARPLVYAVNENAGADGTISAFALDPATGHLTFLNQQPSEGVWPCHLCVDATGGRVLATNYGSGSVVVFPLLADGRLGECARLVCHAGRGPHPARQQGPHAHSVTLAPSNRFAYVADLGADKVMIYAFNAAAAELWPATPPAVEMKPGAGPRHFAFHPHGRQAYVINELDSTVTVFDHDAGSGALTPVQTVPTLPAEFSGASTCADLHVHPSGRFLYGSNRGHDSIAVFAIAGGTGRLTALGHTPTGGKTPRNFLVDAAGNWLLAANQDSGNVVLFRLDPGTGSLTAADAEISLPFPVCLIAARDPVQCR